MKHKESMIFTLEDLSKITETDKMTEIKVPLLVDCDGVLSAFTEACLDLAARQFNVFAQREDVTSNDVGASIGCPALEHLISEETLHREFCYRMKPIVQGVLFFKTLEETYGKDRVFVCTKIWRGDSREKASGEWASQRLAWLRDHLGVNKGRVFMCDNKHMVDGILIDDSVKNFEKRKPGTGFCIAHPYNSGHSGPRGDYQDCLAWLGENVR
jgi:5'(3')-deoxyribonucleotidase